MNIASPRALLDAADAHLGQASDELLDDRSTLTRRLLGGSVADADGAAWTGSGAGVAVDAGTEVVRIKGQV